MRIAAAPPAAAIAEARARTSCAVEPWMLPRIVNCPAGAFASGGNTMATAFPRTFAAASPDTVAEPEAVTIPTNPLRLRHGDEAQPTVRPEHARQAARARRRSAGEVRSRLSDFQRGARQGRSDAPQNFGADQG